MTIPAMRTRRALKRSDCLVFYFRNGKLHCQNYLTGVEVASSPVLVSVLNALDRWRRAEEIERTLPHFSPDSIRATTGQLLRHTLLIEKDSDEERREKSLISSWMDWGVEARFFHWATKRAFQKACLPADEATFIRPLLRRAPQPTSFKRYAGAEQVMLREALPYLHGEFPRVLLARRTHRAFSPNPLPLDEISTLLRLTWGVTGHIEWPGLGKLAVKTSPSGGARQPLETYVWALRVKGLPRGIYHYRSDAHRLERLRSGVKLARVAKLCAGQKWVAGCAALFVMTAVLPRVSWRYKFSRAYRVVLLEAGHFCQTFCLVATWLGLAPFCTAALLDEDIERELGLDGAKEIVLYAAGVGAKTERERR